MAKKTNPQVTIPLETFEELKAISELIGLPSPALVIPVLVKQFGGALKQRFTLSTANPVSAVDSTVNLPSYIPTAVVSTANPVSAVDSMSHESESEPAAVIPDWAALIRNS